MSCKWVILSAMRKFTEVSINSCNWKIFNSTSHLSPSMPTFNTSSSTPTSSSTSSATSSAFSTTLTLPLPLPPPWPHPRHIQIHEDTKSYMQMCQYAHRLCSHINASFVTNISMIFLAGSYMRTGYIYKCKNCDTKFGNKDSMI